MFYYAKRTSFWSGRKKSKKDIIITLIMKNETLKFEKKECGLEQKEELVYTHSPDTSTWCWWLWWSIDLQILVSPLLYHVLMFGISGEIIGGFDSSWGLVPITRNNVEENDAAQWWRSCHDWRRSWLLCWRSSRYLSPPVVFLNERIAWFTIKTPTGTRQYFTERIPASTWYKQQESHVAVETHTDSSYSFVDVNAQCSLNGIFNLHQGWSPWGSRWFQSWRKLNRWRLHQEVGEDEIATIIMMV